MQNKIKMKYFLIIILIVSSCEILQAEEVGNNSFFSTVNKMETQLDNGPEIQNELKIHEQIFESKVRVKREIEAKVAEIVSENVPMSKALEVFKLLNDSLTDYTEHLTKSNQSAKEEPDQLKELNLTIAAYSETIQEQNTQIIKLQAQIDSDGLQLKKLEDLLANDTNIIRENQELRSTQQSELQNITIILNKTQVELGECNDPNLEGLFDSCLPFRNLPGIHTIKIPNIDPFNVLCASATTGLGWIVIQQRINGQEDFYRDWATYKAGFGSFDGDFFLGLEKIHQLTFNRRYELYIQLQRFNGQISYATYNHFAVAGEDDQYKLINVDGFLGDSFRTRDWMFAHKGERFHTFDKGKLSSCSRERHGGWWYNIGCVGSNLNGQYFDHETRDLTSNHWYGVYSLKQIRMLIRPTFH